MNIANMKTFLIKASQIVVAFPNIKVAIDSFDFVWRSFEWLFLFFHVLSAQGDVANDHFPFVGD